MKKIIATDNLNRDTVSERHVATVEDLYAEDVASALNDKHCVSDSSLWYFQVRPEDYVPYKFEP